MQYIFCCRECNCWELAGNQRWMSAAVAAAGSAAGQACVTQDSCTTSMVEVRQSAVI